MRQHSLQARSSKRLTALAVLGVVFAASIATAQVDEAALPDGKKTMLGLYVTAAEAYERWRADPQEVAVLDVRTTEEYLYVGHAPMAWNVPLMSQAYEWDAEKQRFNMRLNPDFVSQVSSLFKPEDPIFVMCRSGGRSAMAVNMLGDAGYTNVYQIVDGMEGDVVKDEASVFKGQRLKNGWKNSGLPWTYKPELEQMRFITEK